MGWGLLGCPCGILSLSPAGLHLPICEVTWGGVLVPPFLKEGRKSPCATAHPVIWGRWQPRGTEDTAPCSTAACLWENPVGPQDGYLDPIFSEIQLQMATGGVPKVPQAAAQHGSEVFISIRGKGIPLVWLGAAGHWLPMRGGEMVAFVNPLTRWLCLPV